jgi:hypothetical protein
MLLTKPSFKLLRICTQKDGKDKIRFCKLLRQFLKHIQQQQSDDTQIRVTTILAPTMGDYFQRFLDDEQFDTLVSEVPDQLIEDIINIAINPDIIRLMLDYQMDHMAQQQVSEEQVSLSYILVCYYQIIGFTNGAAAGKYRTIFGTCQESFRIQYLLGNCIMV